MLIKRFLAKFIVDKDNHWIWIAAKTWDGYGRFKTNGEQILAHRYCWENLIGRIPKKQLVLHKNFCNKRDCINPIHLYIGNMKQNVSDSVRLGTQRNVAKTHCKNGHPFVFENIYFYYDWRSCRICRRNNNDRAYEKRRKNNINRRQ